MRTLALLALLPAASANPVAGSPDPSDAPAGPPADVGLLPIVGGDDVGSPDDWPDVAGISDGWQVFCTGTLIAPNVVITAGHCVLGTRVEEVILGTNDYRDPGEVIEVADIHEYPRSQQGNFDVAVLILERASSIEPRVIATDCIRDEIDDGAEAVVVGYGAIDPNATRYVSELQEGFTEIDRAECDSERYGCAPNILPDGELMAGADGACPCHGDSGGPLFLPTDRGTFLAGVVSRGVDPCGYGGIFGRPDHPDLFAWIEDVTDRRLPRPLCLEPDARPLYFVKNHEAHTQIAPGSDADPFEYEVVTPPINGSAFVGPSGLVTFTPETGFQGSDRVVIRVRDADGWTGELTVPIEAVSRGDYRALTGEKAPCGCASGPSAGAVAGLGALAMIVGRRRRRVL